MFFLRDRDSLALELLIEYKHVQKLRTCVYLSRMNKYDFFFLSSMISKNTEL